MKSTGNSSYSLYLFIIAMGFLISGCAQGVGHKHSVIHDSNINNNIKIRVGEVYDSSYNDSDINIVEILRTELFKIIEKNSLSVADISKGEHLIIESYILDYQPGDAFKRWLLPGYGATEVVVKTKIYSSKGKKYIGFVEANRTVSAGGGFTLGAWKEVFNGIAQDTISEILQKISKH